MEESTEATKAETTSSRQSDQSQQTLPDVPASGDFKRQSVRGGAATIAAQGFGTVLQVGTTLVLARILAPTDYGLQSMVFTLTAFLSLFKDAGLSAATVQRETLTYEQISTLFWINFGLGTFMALVVAAAAPLLAAFYKEPRLLWLTVASSSIFLFDSVSVQHKALLDRSMRFTTSMKIGILSSTVGTVVAIGMALLGFGYWALICQNISLPIVNTIGTWVAMPWWPGKPRWTKELRSMVRFGGTVTVNSFVVYVAYNTEKILLGRFWGPASLGLYSRAYQLANLPVQQLTGSVGGVAIAALSRMQGELQRLRRSYLKAHSLIVSLTVPVVIGCALFADEIVQVVLGPKWIGAAVILRLLSPTVLVLALINPLSWFLRATGRVVRSLKIALVIAPTVILGVVAGLHYGPPGVALGYSIAMVVLAAPLVAWVKHGTGITTHDYWDCIWRPLLAGSIAGAAGWLFKLLSRGVLAPLPMLILELTISFGVYACLLLFVMKQKDTYVDLLSQLFPRKSNVSA